MKKLFTFFIAFLIWGLQTMLATDVSGTISTDSTWNLAGSPYIVTSSVTINQGVTLTIESGVVVKFDDNQIMYVKGTLTASGATFTSNNATPTPGIWGTIQTGDYTYTGVVNLTNCQVLYAQHFYVYNGTATLNNTDLLNFSQNGAYIEAEGIFNMTGGNINTNSSGAASNGNGINGNGNGGSATLTNVTVQHFAHGVNLNNNFNVTLNSSSITNCIWPIFYNASANLSISGTNTFTGNTNTAVYMNAYSITDTLTLPVITIPYFLPGNITVEEGGRLVIGSGNILKFQDGAALHIDGTLIAKANVGEYIQFTSYKDDNWGGDTNADGTISAASSGIWYGIRFEDTSNDVNSLMRRCQVRYAGAGNTGGISMFDASPTIDSCDLSNNYFGIYVRYGSNPVLTNNSIASSQMTAIAMSFEADPVMSNNILSVIDNNYDAIGLIGGTLTKNATLKIRSVTSVENITYLILEQIIIPSGKSLTINKGIVIKSFSNQWDYHRIIVQGTLTANASADSMITFTSARDDNHGNPNDSNKDGTITSPAKGDWGGIIFAPGGSGILNYCRIKYAQVYDYGFTTCSTTEYLNETAVGMIDASPTISNCEFKDLKYGISCYRASNPVLSNNSMINIEFTPICLSGSSNPTISGITFTNNGWNAIGLLGGNVCLNGTIKKRDVAGYTNITYVLLSDMTINSGTNVNVEPGVVIKVNKQYGTGSIFVDGGFKTDGISGQQVVFTSIKDDTQGNPVDSNGDGNATAPAPGDWGSIKYRSTSNDAYCVLNYTTFKFAGNTNEGGVTFENAGGQLKNSIISNTSNYGVFCNGNSTSIIDNVVIQNCSLDPIAMSLTSNPVFTNITFISNFSQAIKIIEGTLSSNAVLAPRNVAGITNIAYIIKQLTISSNAKLTIQPDVVIKFRSDNECLGSFIYVNGNLIANGTSSNKIYFTSFADDSRGGDSNNNGNSSAPVKGDWGRANNCWPYNWTPGGILFMDNSFNADTVNSLKYCEISYSNTSLRIENSHVTISDCLFQLCSEFGASVIGSANPEFNNCQFYNIKNSPIDLSMFSNPSFTNCTALNVGYLALSVVPETYSQTDTIPIRNFGGYNNISYFMEGNCVINSGTTITIPAGIVFKSTNASYNNGVNSTGNIANGFIVNGRLNILGTAGNPVIFTNDKDDDYGNPPDMNQNGSASLPPPSPNLYEWSGDWITFNDVSDDASTIKNVIFKYGSKGIATLSASPTVDSVRFENLYYGVDMNGVSAPKIDNSIFHNLRFYPIQISLVSYPVSSANNIISGTTYKVIKVKDETLTQDVTLPKRNFGGVTNIPYYFEKYNIGTSATLTITPGIVCKFKTREYWESEIGIHVFKGFTAIGGASADSNIVFTSIRDDFYGGDSNSDSAATFPNFNEWSGYSDNWNGLIFEDESLDPLCKLKNCIIRFADKGIKTINSSPTIENCNINNNNYGVYATGSSNPVLKFCDFNDNYNFAVDNVDKSFMIKAENSWWGSNLGPVQSNTQGNGTSLQEIVTDSVDYTPWRILGAGIPLMGDVSLNGLVQAYDASLVLQHVVSLISLNSLQQQVADVSAESGISSLDASLILRYSVGLIQSFPAELKKSSFAALSQSHLTVGSASVMNGEDVNIPLSLSNVSGLYSTDIKLHYDPAYLQVSQVTNMIPGTELLFRDDNKNGILTIAMAGRDALNSDRVLAMLTFHTRLTAGTTTTTSLTVNKFLANESNMTSGLLNGTVTITSDMTGIFNNTGKVFGDMLPVYPNPSTDNAMLGYQLNGDNQKVTIEIFNLLGHKVATIVNETKNKGQYTIPVSKQDSPLESGSYLIRMTVNGVSQTQIFQIVR